MASVLLCSFYEKSKMPEARLPSRYHTKGHTCRSSARFHQHYRTRQTKQYANQALNKTHFRINTFIKLYFFPFSLLLLFIFSKSHKTLKGNSSLVFLCCILFIFLSYIFSNISIGSDHFPFPFVQKIRASSTFFGKSEWMIREIGTRHPSDLQNIHSGLFL